jgi:hypothetical protein
MKKLDYFKWAIQNEYSLIRQWVRFIFSIPLTENDYINIVDGSYIVNINNESVVITDADIDKPLFYPTDEITLPKGFLPIIKEDIKTTIGTVILNYNYLVYGLDNKLDYINEPFTYNSHLQTYVVEHLGKEISVKDYQRLARAISFIRSLSNGIVIPTTMELLVPPKGLDKVRKDTIKSIIDKYGKDAFENPLHILEYEEIVMKWIKEQYKDNKVFNLLFKGKIAKSFKMKYVSIGIPSKLTPQCKDVGIINSLYEGYPKDKEQIAAINNGTRYGSSSRGIETQKSGVIAAMLIRASHSFKVLEGDCKTTDTYPYYVDKNSIDFIEGLNILDGNKLIKLTRDNISKYIGTYVNLRIPYLCKHKDKAYGTDVYCSTCAGEKLSSAPNNIVIVAIGLGGGSIKNSLSKFHGVDRKLNEITYKDIFG